MTDKNKTYLNERWRWQCEVKALTANSIIHKMWLQMKYEKINFIFLLEKTKKGNISNVKSEPMWVSPKHSEKGLKSNSKGCVTQMKLSLSWRAVFSHKNIWINKMHNVLTSWTFSFALMSDGWTREPMTFRLPWTTRASSGRSVLMPTLPWWYTESDSWPRCHSTSVSLSNWPGLDA